MTVAVAVARADDDRPRWPRRHGARRGGQVALAGRGGAPAAAAPAAGGGGDGRRFHGREPRRGHLAAAARGGAARGQGGRGGNGDGHGGGGGGAAGDAPLPVAGRGRGAGGFGDALVPGPGLGGGGGAYYTRGGSGGRDGDAPIKLREDFIDWLDGNPNTQEESSSNIQSVYSDQDVELPARLHREPQFLQFHEPNVFENPHPHQTPEVNEMNNDLLTIFESLFLVRSTIHGLMCRVPLANDAQSLGKEIGGENRKANQLLKDATEKSQAIEAKGGLPVPIPPHFYTGVKPVRVRH